MENKANYSIVWQECGENSPLAERFYVPGYVGFLPFLVYGTDHERLENKEKIELREEQLLKGILYGLNGYKNKDNFWYREESKKTYLYLLETLGKGFGFDNLEKLILSVAVDVRNKIGNNASTIILFTGHDLIPESSQIMSDLITDTWMVLATEKSDELKEVGLRKIVDLVYRIKMDELVPQAKEMVAYFGLTALIILGLEEKVQDYLRSYIYPYVNNRQLKIRIKDMLEDPKKAIIESF